MKNRNAALAAAGLLLWALPSFAQITSLEGYVKGTDGKPLEKAVINIDRTDIKGHYTCKTDKKGHYIYTGLPIGKYNITLIVDGKDADTVKGAQTHPGDPIQNDFDLRKTAQTQSVSKEMQQKALATGEIPKELDKSLSPEEKARMQKQIEEQAAKMKKNAALNKAFTDGTTAKDAGDAAAAAKQRALAAHDDAEAAKQDALATEQYNKALDSFKEASTLDASQIAVWNSMAGAYLALAKIKTGDEFTAATEKGIEAYNKSLELKNDPGTRNNLGLAYAQDKKLPEAQAELEKAVALEPTAACKYYFNLGAVEANAHLDDAAAAAFQKAIAGDPKCAQAYYELGNSLMMKATTKPDGTVEPAPGTVEAFQKYLEVAPDGPKAVEAKGMLEALGSKVETNYVDPKAKKGAPPKKK